MFSRKSASLIVESTSATNRRAPRLERVAISAAKEDKDHLPKLFSRLPAAIIDIINIIIVYTTYEKQQ